MLTVLKTNTAGLALYQALRYKPDESSPAWDDDEFGHVILSKCVNPVAWQGVQAAWAATRAQ
jgi:hypothetical protein